MIGATICAKLAPLKHHGGATGGIPLHHQVVPLFFYACRPYNRVRTGWCHQILVWSVEQTRVFGPQNFSGPKKLFGWKKLFGPQNLVDVEFHKIHFDSTKNTSANLTFVRNIFAS